MRKLLNYTVLLLLVGYLVLFGLRNRALAGEQICAGVSVELLDASKAHFILPSEIEKSVTHSGLAPQGKRLNEINTEAIEELLLKNQLIQTAQCYKTPTGTIRIDVTQRNPILRVFGFDGSFYVDENGETMPTSTQYSIYLPVASGAITKEFARKSLYRLALYLRENSFWNAQIQQIYVRPGGDLILIPRVGRHTINIGNAEELDRKFNNLMALYEQALPRVGWDKYEAINLKYLNQVICTRRE